MQAEPRLLVAAVREVRDRLGKTGIWCESKQCEHAEPSVIPARVRERG